MGARAHRGARGRGLGPGVGLFGHRRALADLLDEREEADGADDAVDPLVHVLRDDEELAWVVDARMRLGELHLRALEAYAQAGLGIGGTELAAAVRAGRELTRRDPYRESGHRLLMTALAREGNTAEALLIYDQLRTRLQQDLGAAPSPQTQELHKQLLR